VISASTGQFIAIVIGVEQLKRSRSDERNSEFLSVPSGLAQFSFSPDA